MSIAQFETPCKPSSAAYGKKRNGGLVTEGRLTTTRTGETFEKSVSLSYESALALQRVLNANPDIESAEMKRNHHVPNSYYVRYRVALSADAGGLTGDLNLRRSLHQSGEFRSEPLPDTSGAFLVVHSFPLNLGGGWETKCEMCADLVLLQSHSPMCQMALFQPATKKAQGGPSNSLSDIVLC